MEVCLVKNIKNMKQKEKIQEEAINNLLSTDEEIVIHLINSFDKFREGMDKLATIYNIIEQKEPELYIQISRFGKDMTKLIGEFAGIIEQQGISVDDPTKGEGLEQYFGTSGLSAIGINENKTNIFNTRVDLNIDRIKTIINNSK